MVKPSSLGRVWNHLTPCSLCLQTQREGVAVCSFLVALGHLSLNTFEL